jgi:hypothetical protein
MSEKAIRSADSTGFCAGGVLDGGAPDGDNGRQGVGRAVEVFGAYRGREDPAIVPRRYADNRVPLLNPPLSSRWFHTASPVPAGP